MENIIIKFAQIVFYVTLPVTSILTYIQARKIAKNTSNSNKDSKKVDVMMVFHKRYDDLEFDKKPRQIYSSDSGDLSGELKSYYYRFWNLQFDQWEYSRLGFLDDEIYSHWLTRRRLERKSLNEEERKIFDKGFEYAKDKISKPKFSKFIDKVVYGIDDPLQLIMLEKKLKVTQ